MFHRIQQYQLQTLQRPIISSIQSPFYYQAQHHYETLNHQSVSSNTPQIQNSAQTTPTLQKRKMLFNSGGNFNNSFDDNQNVLYDTISSENTFRPKLTADR